MEIQSADGSKTLLKLGSITEFGRGAGFNDDDRTVSRRQISFQLQPSSHHEGNDPRVRFEVVGKNPIWFHSSKSGGVKTYRSSESGEMETGDMFCVSAKKPIWFTLKRTDFEAQGETNSLSDSELAGSLGSSHSQRGVEELELDSINLSDIDPVKEFGLVVMGCEFDGYPKKMIRDIKNWDWYIEELRDESDNEEGRVRKKRKQIGTNDDEEWTGESEEEEEEEGKAEAITKSRKSQRLKYTTRSKDRGKPSKGVGKEKLSSQRKIARDDESEDDETLGGFIVEDEELEEDEDVGNEEEEEEEFNEAEYEDDLED